MILVLGVTVLSWATDVGDYEVVFDYSVEVSSDATGVNASISAADGEIWVAVEWADDYSDLAAGTHLDLFHSDGFSADRRTLSSGRLTNALDQALMYTSVSTWSGAADVKVVGKEDQGTNQQAHMEFFSLDRDSIDTATVASSGVGGSTNQQQHGRMHLAYDPDVGSAQGSDALYVCWTTRDTSPSVQADDVYSKGKPASVGWGAHSTRVVEATADPAVDDHCQQDFARAGERYTIFHSDQNTADDVFLLIDSLDATSDTWTHITEFALTTSIDVDFPTLAIFHNGTTYDTMTAVAQRPANDDYLVWWTCGSSRTSCDSSSEWGTGVAEDVDGAHARQPEVVNYGMNRFLAWENTATVGGSVLHSVGIASMCSGESSWTMHGTFANDSYDDCVWAADLGFPGSAVSQLAVDRTDASLHAVLFCSDGVGERPWVPIHWHVAQDELCP